MPEAHDVSVPARGITVSSSQSNRDVSGISPLVYGLTSDSHRTHIGLISDSYRTQAEEAPDNSPRNLHVFLARIPRYPIFAG